LKLHSEGFNFQPRKLEQQKKRKVNPSGRDMTWTPAAVGKSSSTHVLDAAPNSAPVEKKKPRNNGKAVQPSATAPPLEVSRTVPPTDALPSSSCIPTQGNIGVSTPHILPTKDNIGLSSQVENQCKVGDAVPTSVDLGHVGISDEVLPAAADLGPGKETTTTVPPTEALPISSNLPPVLPTGENIGLCSLPTGDNIGLCSQVHNQSEVGPGNALTTVKEEEVTESLPGSGLIPVDMDDVGTTDELLYAAAGLGTQDETATMLRGDGTKVHYDSSDIVKDGATVVLGPTGEEEEVTESSPATGPIPVDMGDIETTDELLYAAAELGTQDETATTLPGDGTKVHYDASDIVKDGATVALGPTGEEEEVTESLPATGPIPVDMGDIETTDQLLFGAAELGTQDETDTTLPGDGTKEHYDASEVVEGHATIAVVPSATRELRQRVGGRNDGDLVDVTTKRKSQRKKNECGRSSCCPQG
jgi:hypothetical protein